MDILKQAERIVRKAEKRKPPNIIMGKDDWRIAKDETRALLLEIKRLELPLEALYHQAINERDFETALYSYQAYMSQPFSPSLNRIIYPETQCQKNESDFINKAKNWILRVKVLLGEEI